MCRTISWSQACDLHVDMMRRVVRTLWYLRTSLPPVAGDGWEVRGGSRTTGSEWGGGGRNGSGGVLGSDTDD